MSPTCVHVPTDPTIAGPTFKAHRRETALGAGLAVFGASLAAFTVTIPMWAAHVAEYDKGDHANDMFGDPAGFVFFFAALIFGPIAFVIVGLVGARIATVGQRSTAATKPRGYAALGAVLMASGVIGGYIILKANLDTLGLPISPIVVSLVLGGAAATAGLIVPLQTASR